jgi:trk system potassium uptake protein TrkH
MEWTGALSSLSPGDRLANAWFQATTLRTAGFSSIDLSSLHPATVSIMLALMFIGGCPGSTAGGIKTTTAALMFLSVAASLKGRVTPQVFARRIGHATLVRATAIVTLAALTIAAGVLMLQLTQPIPWKSAVFEVISATGTVGLSLGATSALDGVGKVTVMFCMFAGRVGPLSLFLLIGGDSPVRRWAPPTEELAVG